MPTADQIIALMQAALDNDRQRIISASRQIAANERPNSTLQGRIVRVLDRSNINTPTTPVAADLKGLVMQMTPTHRLHDVTLPQTVEDNLQDFLQERQHAAAIRAAGFSLPSRILLSGPPGNGKTTLAGAIAQELDLPFLVLDYSTVVSSYMGETGANIAKTFRSIAQTANQHPAVLFIDEMETVLTERSGTPSKSNDTGEIARVVSTLLIEIDRLPDSIILIGATNHQEMLDRAVVRRFDHHWELPAPNTVAIQQWLQHYSQRHPHIPFADYASALGHHAELKALSLSDLERQANAWCRRWVVSTSRQSLQS